MTEQEKAALVERLKRLAENLKWHNVHYALDVLRAVDELNTPPAPAIPDGWQLVPIEPTDEMLIAGDIYMDGISQLFRAWAAMLEAAPNQEKAQ